MKFAFEPLGYPYDSLEPHIDKETMMIHHTKHHQGYVNNLNAALEKHPEIQYDSLPSLMLDNIKLPFDIRTAVINNGGGVFNHNFFFSTLKLNENGRPSGKLLEDINSTFGSFEQFKDAFANAAKTRFGSGWAWLIQNHQGGLEVVSTPNQDPVLPLGTPLLGLDVWEHAYYLKYQNRRPEYIDNFFHVIDWDKVASRYQA